MEKTLNHEEIDTLLEVAAERKSNPRRIKAATNLLWRATFGARVHSRRNTCKQSARCMTRLRETLPTRWELIFAVLWKLLWSPLSRPRIPSFSSACRT